MSSSRIRAALDQADLTTAKALLGRAYRFQGRVVRGRGLGRELGWPTANLQVNGRKALPGLGVYAAWAQLDGDSDRLPAVMNLGPQPTIDPTSPSAVEVHLLDQSLELEGRQLGVEPVGLEGLGAQGWTLRAVQRLCVALEVACGLDDRELVKETSGLVYDLLLPLLALRKRGPFVLRALAAAQQALRDEPLHRRREPLDPGFELVVPISVGIGVGVGGQLQLVAGRLAVQAFPFRLAVDDVPAPLRKLCEEAFIGGVPISGAGSGRRYQDLLQYFRSQTGQRPTTRAAAP